MKNGKITSIIVLTALFVLILFAIADFAIAISPEEYLNMKPEQINGLNQADFNKMLESDKGIERLNQQDVWDKLDNSKKEEAFKKNFKEFSFRHGDEYFSGKLKLPVQVADSMKYDGTMLTTEDGKMGINVNEIPYGTGAIDFSSGSMRITTTGDNKITLMGDGIIAGDRTVTLSSGEKISLNMNEYKSGQEISIERRFDIPKIDFIGTDKSTSISMKNPYGEVVQFSRGSSNDKGMLYLGGNLGEGADNGYYAKNIRMGTSSLTEVNIPNEAKLYFDDSNHLAPNYMDKGSQGLRATEKSFVQFNGEGDISAVQGRDMQIYVNQEVPGFKVQGERVSVNDNGNKFDFIGPEIETKWANPEHKSISGEKYTNTFKNWNVHNAEINLRQFEAKFLKPVSDTLGMPLKATKNTIKGFATGIGGGFGQVIKAFAK